MYGPPPDPLRQLAPDGPLDQPLAWALSFGISALLLILAARQRRGSAAWLGLAAAGLSAALLAPAPALGPTPWFGDLWWGEFPTIDKAGSYAFFRAGAHHRAWPWSLPDGTATRLIGAHLGHLQLVGWVAVALPPHAAFGLVAVLQPMLGWAAAAWWLRGRGAGPYAALALGLPFGLGLHVLRDVNWYTIEKAAVYWLPLWLGLIDRSGRRAAMVPVAAVAFLWICWNNLYLGVVAGILGLGEGLGLLGRLRVGAPDARQRLLALALSAAAAVPLLRAQAGLLADGGPGLGDPARFLRERAALDVLSAWPPRWNRLELWRSVDPLAAALGLAGGPALARARGGGAAALTAGLLTALALGPRLALTPGGDGPANPAYTLLITVIPGAWRIAKPEVFFEGALLILLLSGALHLSRRPTRVQISALLIILAAWWPLVRAHPVYPGHSRHQELSLDPRWAERTLR